MKRITISFYLLLASTALIHAQSFDFNHFTALRSVGPVPEEFTKLSSEKFFEDKENIDETTNSREKADRESFLLESNFLMDEILHSGKVIFGDDVTVYLNQMKDLLLKDEPEIRDKIRVYTLLSNEVNAFTSDNGIVLVTTGLISQVENEAQIAFILCHEFNHYIQKHAINSYIENRKIERGAGVYSNIGNSKVDLEKFRYSKELETEADKLGLTLFYNSNYSLAAAQGAFDVLLYSYLPFDEVPFDSSYFNDGLYQLPSVYFLDSVKGITATEDYDDEESTHPNIKKRREAMFQSIKGMKDKDRTAFILPEQTFHHVQALCRFEGCELYLTNREYEDAVYQAFLLQQQDSSNLYLKKVVAKSLYGLSVYHNAGILPDDHRYYKSVEGNSQQVFHFFYKLKDTELNILALKYAWEAHKAEPENKQLTEMCVQLAKEMQVNNEINMNTFYTKRQAAGFIQKELNIAADTIVTEEEEAPKYKSKYEKIKEDVKPTEVRKDKSVEYWRFAFIPYLDDETFKALTDSTENKSKEKLSKSGSTKQKEYQLGLNEIVFVNPVYISIDERNEQVEYQKAESSRLALRDKIYENADMLDLKVTYIDHNSIQKNETDAFNDMALLNRWISEKLDHIESEVNIINLNSDELAQLSGKYDSENFAWLGIMAFKEKERNVGGKVLLCIIYPVAPIIIYNLINPNYTTFFFTLVVNCNSGNIEMQYYNDTKINDSPSIQNSNIYYILQQIKTPPSE